ncbi:MAG: DNA polymerase III subunit chi [Alphaproteobacteria bacterium]|nr:DNA polymerase III subunit chi [Alphaproteobacteria bacterium]
MSEVSFYHLQRVGLERALPKLLEKALERGLRVVVRAGSDERVEALNSALWTYDQDSFLPHGAKADGFAAQQPIYLTADAVGNPNSARMLVLVDGMTASDVGAFERVLDLFDGNDAEAVEAARGRWRTLQSGGHALTYWQQTDSGGWEKKA